MPPLVATGPPQGQPFIPDSKYATPEALRQAEARRQAKAARQGATEFIPTASQKKGGPRKAKELVAKKVIRLMNRQVPWDAMEVLRRMLVVLRLGLPCEANDDVVIRTATNELHPVLK